MRQLAFVEPGRLEWQEAAVPEPAPGQAVIRPLAVARCDLDAAMAAFGLFAGPYPVGHEIAGEVVEVGSGVTRLRPGQRVAVPFQVSCGRCAPAAKATTPRANRAARAPVPPSGSVRPAEATAAASPTCCSYPMPTTYCWRRGSRSAMSRWP